MTDRPRARPRRSLKLSSRLEGPFCRCRDDAVLTVSPLHLATLWSCTKCGRPIRHKREDRQIRFDFR